MMRMVEEEEEEGEEQQGRATLLHVPRGQAPAPGPRRRPHRVRARPARPARRRHPGRALPPAGLHVACCCVGGIGICDGVRGSGGVRRGKLLGGVEKVMSCHINGSLVPLLKQAGALWL
uniref:Uncharacterized protein n=1 Tax=Ananas comosus var. bracteatus TaxID=296719 RepID=A0A6V7QF61_ANACO|nr:unnamed protein product [Ananas comosus var. bracteatus]